MEQKTFREAYEVLQRHAETLRNQDEPNIDDLLAIVNESVDAYKVCKQRIDAVEKALEEALISAGLEGSGRGERAASVPNAGGARGPLLPSRGLEDVEDDTPF
ncbi:exodeoxyribonuclease VII small subunit [Achromobacter xylosoxidans]|uniref:exodeoxyribonuclease VII small subunit n=1 Tax=Alcaligenes xylosoxydans xylosoxydans TaxID=85698 RepID=UPI0006662AF4|nr:exodeoxyribonuclease VII small subunit [Achromobacter xylosoxidans]